MERKACRVVENFYLGDLLTARILMSLSRQTGYRDVKKVVNEIRRDVGLDEGDDVSFHMKVLRRLKNLAECGVLQYDMQHLKNKNVSKYILVLDSTLFIDKSMKLLIKLEGHGISIHDCRNCDKRDCMYRPIFFEVLGIEDPLK